MSKIWSKVSVTLVLGDELFNTDAFEIGIGRTKYQVFMEKKTNVNIHESFLNTLLFEYFEQISMSIIEHVQNV